MVDLNKIDDELYISKYGIPKVGNYQEIWSKIKINKELLKAAIKVIKVFGERDIVAGLAICDSMLVDYESVDKDIYQELVNTIYSNQQIARIVQDGASNGGYSYLLMTLWNHDLILTEEQKSFAVDEAMNKIGTVRYKEQKEKFSKMLDERGISNNVTTLLDIDGCVNPIGAKTGSEYLNSLITSLSNTQAHGEGAFDIRYYILRNPNWTLEEKQKLIMDFWYDDETYDEYLEQWEWGIVNDSVNYRGRDLPLMDKFQLYDYSYDILLQFYGDKEVTDRIWDEIQFCKQMHAFRPQQWELEFKDKQKVL